MALLLSLTFLVNLELVKQNSSLQRCKLLESIKRPFQVLKAVVQKLIVIIHFLGEYLHDDVENVRLDKVNIQVIEQVAPDRKLFSDFLFQSDSYLGVNLGNKLGLLLSTGKDYISHLG